MLYKKYFSSNFVNQEIFNKKVNWFFDIKSILYQKRNNYKQETLKHSKIIVNNFLKKKLYKKNKIKIQKITVEKINKSAFLKRDKVYKMKILKCFNYLQKNKIDDYQPIINIDVGIVIPNTKKKNLIFFSLHWIKTHYLSSSIVTCDSERYI